MQPIHTYLAHISRARRTMVLPAPPDQYGRRWPLKELTERSLKLLDAYVKFVADHGQVGAPVAIALADVQTRAHDLRSALHL